MTTMASSVPQLLRTGARCLPAVAGAGFGAGGTINLATIFHVFGDPGYRSMSAFSPVPVLAVALCVLIWRGDELRSQRRYAVLPYKLSACDRRNE